MTDEEFIAKLTDAPDMDDLCNWIDWHMGHPQLRELANEPQFKDWLGRAFDENGCSKTDEHYVYFGKTEIDRELGRRLTWLTCLGQSESRTLSDEDDFFPLYADSFSYDNKKYWVLTMVGQGAISWLMTDEAFKKEYEDKEN